MKVAVTGATGIVGRFVVARLRAEGVAIRALVRPSSDRSGLRGDLETIVGDMTDSDTLTALVDGMDAVFIARMSTHPGATAVAKARTDSGFGARIFSRAWN